MDIKGHTVHTVLVAEDTDIAQEYYLSFLLDRSDRTFLSMCSVEGGVEIEEVARTKPEALARIPVSPLTGVDARQGAGDRPAPAACRRRRRPARPQLAERLWAVFTDEDATLVEVNPLVYTGDGRVVALDAKVTLDDNAAFRQDCGQFADPGAADPLEARAKAKHLNYVKLDGSVGIIGNGAGLVMSTLDVVAYAGEEFGGVRPANFLDIGGGASAEVMANGLEIVLSDPSVRSVLVNVFGGITSCDAVANGIVSAIGMLARARRAGEAPDRGPAGRQQRGRGPAHTRRGRDSRGRAGGHHGRCGAARRRTGRRGPRREHEMAIFLTGDSRIIVQGITGSEGRRHGARMIAAGTKVVGGTNPRKAGQTVELAGARGAGVRHGRRGDGRPPAPTSRWSSCRRPAPRTP